MARRILRIAGALLALGVVLAGVGLVSAHRAIRAQRTPLPSVEEVVAAREVGAQAPLRISWINTASQPMPRSAVLDGARDPAPDEPYVMSHAAFVLEWEDGRILLVDTGMSNEQAQAFGKPIERLAGAQPIETHPTLQAALGDARERVRGIVFTHLHEDHVGGLVDLCRTVRHDLQIFMTPAQDVVTNYTTRAGRRLVAETPCAQVVRVDGPPLLELADFPGVYLVHAGGHTPGSQVLIAHVGAPGERRTFVFTGDIVNAEAGILHDVPKPFAYRTFVVPEDEERQAELRHWLRQLHDEAGARLLVSHDQRALEAAGLETFRSE